MAASTYLADTTIYVLLHLDRYPAVDRRIESLIADGRLAVCQMSALEILNTASDPKEYETLRRSLRGQRWMDVTSEAMDRALEVHHQLAKKSQHRNFSLPDLVIAATAEVHGATVLHYDADYDRIAAVTNQPVEWVAERGSL